MSVSRSALCSLLVLQGEDAPFIVTTFIETPNQKLGLCAEVGIFVGVNARYV